MDEIKIGRYRHFKGNEYEVLYVARHSETLEPMVVYRALYDEHGVWVRPASMWNETVVRDGHQYQRFEDCLFDLHSVWVNARERKGQFLVSIDFVCDTDLSGHKADADLYSCEDGTCRFTFQLQKGGEGV